MSFFEKYPTSWNAAIFVLGVIIWLCGFVFFADTRGGNIAAWVGGVMVIVGVVLMLAGKFNKRI